MSKICVPVVHTIHTESIWVYQRSAPAALTAGQLHHRFLALCCPGRSGVRTNSCHRERYSWQFPRTRCTGVCRPACFVKRFTTPCAGASSRDTDSGEAQHDSSSPSSHCLRSRIPIRPPWKARPWGGAGSRGVPEAALPPGSSGTVRAAAATLG